MAARHVQVEKFHRARCTLGPWRGAEHPDYQRANAERQAHLDQHARGEECKAPGPELTITQQVTVELARELLAADRGGGPARVVTATDRNPHPAALTSPHPYAYTAAVARLGLLLQVVDELTGYEPEAGQ